MEPDFEVPELSLPGNRAVPHSRSVRLRLESALREGRDPALSYRVLDVPSAGVQGIGTDAVWIDDDGRPRAVPAADIERRHRTRLSVP